LNLATDRALDVSTGLEQAGFVTSQLMRMMDEQPFACLNLLLSYACEQYFMLKIKTLHCQ